MASLDCRTLTAYNLPVRSLFRSSAFDRPTCEVASSLLGSFLVRRIGRKSLSGMITEAEAYDGPLDKASHAHRGKTERNAVMFGPAGRWYVYLVYGMHWMLNIVTGEEGYPAAVLIRGVVLPDGTVLNGPAKVTGTFHIDRALNGATAGKRSGLWIEERGVVLPRKAILRTPRIGIPYAQEWALKPYRFILVR